MDGRRAFGNCIVIIKRRQVNASCRRNSVFRTRLTSLELHPLVRRKRYVELVWDHFFSSKRLNAWWVVDGSITGRFAQLAFLHKKYGNQVPLSELVSLSTPSPAFVHPTPLNPNKAKAKGLLEVIALISGDTTRRNVPGNAFRRAKARLLKKGREAGLISRDSGQQKDVENDKDDTSGRKPFKDLGLSRALSRVTEEDCMSRDSSFVIRNMNGFDSRDLETGGSGGRDNFRNGMVAPEGVQGALEVIGGSGNDDMPWSSRHGDRNRGNAGDIERGPKASTGRRAERSRSPRGQRATGGSGRSGGAREPSATARSTDPWTSVRRNEQGLGNGGASGRSGQTKGSSGIISYEEACKRLNEDSSDGSGRLPECARAGPNETGPDRNGDGALDISLGGHRRGPSRGGGGTRSSIRLADTLNEAKLRRDRWSRSVGKEDETDLPVEGGVEVGKVKMAKVEITKVTKSNQNSRVGLSRSPRIGVVNDSSGEEKVDIAAVPTSSGLLGSRSHRRTAPKLPPDGSELSSSARLGVGAKDHSNAKAKRTKTGSSRGRSSARSRASDTGSQLDDVRILTCDARYDTGSTLT